MKKKILTLFLTISFWISPVLACGAYDATGDVYQSNTYSNYSASAVKVTDTVIDLTSVYLSGNTFYINVVGSLADVVTGVIVGFMVSMEQSSQDYFIISVTFGASWGCDVFISDGGDITVESPTLSVNNTGITGTITIPFVCSDIVAYSYRQNSETSFNVDIYEETTTAPPASVTPGAITPVILDPWVIWMIVAIVAVIAVVAIFAIRKKMNPYGITKSKPVKPRAARKTPSRRTGTRVRRK